MRALVTGANRGIGFAIARGLAEAGHEVIVGARDPEDGRAAAGRIGGRAVEIDLMDPASIAHAASQAGPIEILVNNAGVLHDVSLIAADNDFAEAMQVMVHAPHALIRAVLPGMEAAGQGRIVNVSSGWGAHAEGLAGPGAYGVAKAALNALTRALARDLPPFVACNAMCPGWVRTRMGGQGATKSPEEGADTAIWLATRPEPDTGRFWRDRREIPW